MASPGSKETLGLSSEEGQPKEISSTKKTKKDDDASSQDTVLERSILHSSTPTSIIDGTKPSADQAKLSERSYSGHAISTPVLQESDIQRKTQDELNIQRNEAKISEPQGDQCDTEDDSAQLISPRQAAMERTPQTQHEITEPGNFDVAQEPDTATLNGSLHSYSPTITNRSNELTNRSLIDHERNSHSDAPSKESCSGNKYWVGSPKHANGNDRDHNSEHRQGTSFSGEERNTLNDSDRYCLDSASYMQRSSSTITSADADADADADGDGAVAEESIPESSGDLQDCSRNQSENLLDSRNLWELASRKSSPKATSTKFRFPKMRQDDLDALQPRLNSSTSTLRSTEQYAQDHKELSARTPNPPSSTTLHNSPGTLLKSESFRHPNQMHRGNPDTNESIDDQDDSLDNFVNLDVNEGDLNGTKENTNKDESHAAHCEDRAFIADSAMPLTKLEVLSKQGAHFIIYSLLTTSVFSIGVSLYIIIASDLATTSTTVPALIVLEGLELLVSATILFFLLISFPQRIIVRGCRGLRVLPQQVLIVILIVYLALVPDFGVITAIYYWIDYLDALDRVSNVNLNGEDIYLYLLTENSTTANSASQISISLLFFFWASLLRIAGYYSLSIEVRLQKLNLRETKRKKRRQPHIVIETASDSKASSADRTAFHLIKDSTKNGSSTLTHQPSDGISDDEEESFADIATDLGSELETDTDSNESFDNESGFPPDDDLMFRRARDGNNRGSTLKEMDTFIRQRNHKQRMSEDLEPEVRAVAHAHKRRYFLSEARRKTKSCVHHIQKASNEMGIFSCYYCCCCFICCSYERCASRTSIRGVLRRGMAWNVFIIIVVYTILFAVVNSAYNFSSSIVPLVGMITVLRVCGNVDDQQHSYCSLAHYPLAFRRAFSSVALFAVEVFIFFYIGRISRQVYERMAGVPYALNRPNYLGFAFIQTSIGVFWSVVFFISILELTIPDVSSFILRPVDNSTTLSSNNFTMVSATTSNGTVVVYYVDPLYSVGISNSAASFSALGVLFTTWVYLVSYAWLPADSSKLKGWFVGSRDHSNKSAKGPKRKAEEMNPIGELMKTESMETILKRYFDENPVLISTERRFRKVFLQQHMEFAQNTRPKHQSRYLLLKATGISGRFDDDEVHNTEAGETTAWQKNSDFVTLQQSKPPEPASNSEDYNPSDAVHTGLQHGGAFLHQSLVRAQSSRASRLSAASNKLRMIQRQLLSHVLVIETEILLFNFAALTYKLGIEAWRVPPVEELAKVGTSEFRLLEHIVDEAFDTHIIVARSADRVIISFRGTVSSLNVDTDLDLQMAPFPQAQNIDPLPSTSTIERLASEKIPKIHRGFLKAYESIKERLHELVDPLIQPSASLGPPRQKRAVLCTGHSLGGALAVVCAFDFACYLKSLLNENDHPAIGCTTFGCPRIGTYSFLKRYRRMVPSTKRFVIASDIIPKTPPRMFKTMYSGYHHVGTELLLDLNGNLLISPHSVERAMLHGFRRVNTRMHFCSRYCLGLTFWCTRMKIDPDMWPIHINDMLTYAKSDILKRDKKLLQSAYGVFMKEGVISNLDAVEKRNIGTQVDLEAGELLLPREQVLSKQELMELDDAVCQYLNFEKVKSKVSDASTNSSCTQIDELSDSTSVHVFSVHQLEALHRLLQTQISSANQ